MTGLVRSPWDNAPTFDWGDPLATAVFAGPHVVAVHFAPRLGDKLMPFVTLVLAIRSTGGIVLLGDGRVTTADGGTLIREADDYAKLCPVGRYGIGLSGFEGMTEEIREVLLAAQGRLNDCASTGDAADAMTGLLLEKFTARFPRFEFSKWPSASVLVAGYDATGRTPQIFVLHSKAGFSKSPYRQHCVGTDHACAVVRVLHRLLLPETALTVEVAQQFGLLAMRLVEDVDLTVGGELRMGLVTPAGYADISERLADVSASVDARVATIRAVLTSPDASRRE